MSRLSKRVATIVPPIRRRQRRIEELERQLKAAKGKLEQAKTGRAEALKQLHSQEAKSATLERRTKRLEGTVAELRGARDRSSFKTQLVHYRSTYAAMAKLKDPSHLVMRQIPYKLRNYSFAQSHGVNVPEVFKVWSSPSDVDLSTVSADSVVLKADGGANGRAVWPLVRDGDSWVKVGGKLRLPDGPLPEDLVQQMKEARGPYFAEEMLEGSGASVLPEDIKFYMAYGDVLQVLVMQQGKKGSVNRELFTRTYLDERGKDLGSVLLRKARYGSLKPPSRMPDLVSAAKKLSVAAGVPFIRVDLYQTARGPVLGELTLLPGGRQEYIKKHDQGMGRKWVRGKARLERDIAAGRPPGMLFGSDTYDWHYPANETEGPDSWPRIHAQDPRSQSARL